MQWIDFDPKRCPYCDQLFTRRDGESAWDFRARKFCNSEHYHLFSRGANHHNFKDGTKKRPDGYIRFTNNSQYVHRQVMAEHLGRPLIPDEFIHHKDDDPTNNNISNLRIMTNSSHRLLHVKNQKRNKAGRFTK